ncbi:hypothetical protein NLM16_27850 [Bradyrhizobium brasilense]|uniref:hypothetical protein n=1 Tax=Bradyrhizobium brasilense TaxID=1419277 RepID=UPI0028777C17|nr:hypothetical protein [Bradyrhizobium brasilense]MCP3417926.1 hypothetical protein [Bradyrhizobium brasilense]
MLKEAEVQHLPNSVPNRIEPYVRRFRVLPEGTLGLLYEHGRYVFGRVDQVWLLGENARTDEPASTDAPVVPMFEPDETPRRLLA